LVWGRRVLTSFLPLRSQENKLIEHYITSAIGITLIFIGIIVTFAVRRSNAPASAKVYVTERI